MKIWLSLASLFQPLNFGFHECLSGATPRNLAFPDRARVRDDFGRSPPSSSSTCRRVFDGSELLLGPLRSSREMSYVFSGFHSHPDEIVSSFLWLLVVRLAVWSRIHGCGRNKNLTKNSRFRVQNSQSSGFSRRTSFTYLPHESCLLEDRNTVSLIAWPRFLSRKNLVLRFGHQEGAERLLLVRTCIKIA